MTPAVDSLRPLALRLALANRAYQNYLANGRTFLFASILRDHNWAARQIALEYGHLLPADLLPEVVLLIEHLDVWLLRWEELRAELSPGNDQEFVFQNAFTFPA